MVHPARNGAVDKDERCGIILRRRKRTINYQPFTDLDLPYVLVFVEFASDQAEDRATPLS